jgi:ribosomal protein L11 methyltransferase
MKWIEARVSTVSEGVETVTGVLLSCGIQGVQIIDNNEMRRFLQEAPFNWDYVDETLMQSSYTEDEMWAEVLFYVTPDEGGQAILRQAEEKLQRLTLSYGSSLGSLTLTNSIADDRDWLEEWKKYYKPFRIGRSVVIKPVWEFYAAGPKDIVFTIDPGSVFGTGLHQSTRLCVEALEDYVRVGHSVLDIGCGRGILSIIALLFGAGSALACDYEPAAAVSARENASLNNITADRYEIYAGDVFTDNLLRSRIRRRTYDIITANIVADVVIRLAAEVCDWLSPDGTFIVSGIIAERITDVKTAMAQNYFNVISVLEKDGWYCAVCVLRGNDA